MKECSVSIYPLSEIDQHDWSVLQNIIWKESAQRYTLWFAFTAAPPKMTINHVTKTITFYTQVQE